GGVRPEGGGGRTVERLDAFHDAPAKTRRRFDVQHLADGAIDRPVEVTGHRSTPSPSSSASTPCALPIRATSRSPRECSTSGRSLRSCGRPPPRPAPPP